MLYNNHNNLLKCVVHIKTAEKLHISTNVFKGTVLRFFGDIYITILISKCHLVFSLVCCELELLELQSVFYYKYFENKFSI